MSNARIGGAESSAASKYLAGHVSGGPRWRFDPIRTAVLLVAGNLKAGPNR